MHEIAIAGRRPANGRCVPAGGTGDRPLVGVAGVAGVAAAAGLFAAALLVGCGGTVRTPTEPTSGGPTVQALTFSQIQTSIFTPTCAKSACHSSATATGGLVLEAGRAYVSIVGRPSQEEPQLEYVRPGSPDASYLLEKVRGDAGISGSRMPQDGPPFLSAQQIAGIAAWIQAGAPNN